MRLNIQGIGITGGFGTGREALLSAISSGGATAQHVSVKTSQGPCDMPVFPADVAKLDDFINKRVLRRVDHYSKLALLGAHLALEDAGKLEGDRSKMGIIIASGWGASRTTFAFLDSFINDGDNLSSPTFFSNSVQNAAAAHVSMMLNITGPGLSVSQFDLSVPSAILAAENWLREEEVDSVLLGAVDEYCDVLGYCWQRYWGEKATADHTMDPLAFDIQTAIPAEGAVFFLLTADKGGSSSYGFIKDTVMSHCAVEPPDIATDVPLFIGADGQRQCGGYYKEHLPQGKKVACYTPAYGSIPVGPAFDMAIAAISRKEGKFYGSPCSADLNGKITLIENGSPVAGKDIACLKIDSEGRYGLITLGE